MGLLILAIVVLFVVFPVPMLLVSLAGFVLWLVVAILTGLTEIVSGLFPEPRKTGSMAWDNACQPVSLTVTVAIFRLLCFALLCLLAYALASAALVYSGPIVAGLVLLLVAFVSYLLYIKTAA